MNLSPLTPADIPEVMRIERIPGYEDFVGRFDADEHAAQMASPNARYVGLRDGDGLSGFVILQQLDEPEVLLRRIAVSQVQAGVGTRLVRGVMDWVFQTTPAATMVLDVALGNPRARHVYQREGFSQYAEDGVHYLMRVTRERWAELR
jgi:RimJ/RimL family protein N-acetyltransferase